MSCLKYMSWGNCRIWLDHGDDRTLSQSLYADDGLFAEPEE